MNRFRHLRAKAVEFFCLPASPYPFVFLRIGIAVVLLIRALGEYDILLELYGNRGLIPWAISEIRPVGWLPNMSWVAGLLGTYGVSEDNSVYIVFVIYVIGLLGMFAGWHARIMTGVVWVTHLIIFESASFSSYGVDSFINIALFYSVIMPGGATISLFDAFGKPALEPTATAQLILRLLQFHICIVYLTSGLEKAKGIQWWNGEAIWRAVMQPQFQTFDMSWLASVPALAILASCGTLAIEIGYSFLIWPRRTRPYCLLAVVSLHLCIGIILGLRLFAAVLIVLNLAAFGASLLSAFNATLNNAKLVFHPKKLSAKLHRPPTQ